MNVFVDFINYKFFKYESKSLNSIEIRPDFGNL